LAFKVFLHPKAAKALEKIDAATKARTKTALKDLAGSPEKAGKQLKLTDFYSLRIGDYRAFVNLPIGKLVNW
jgi:mRNA-degrading endonuclease RelE of RelBE toxin-antitoxin system